MGPIAYHITFGTYGTRLHGDPRATVSRDMNKPGDPIIGSNPSWWKQERDRLNFEPVVFSREQMQYAESQIPLICARGGWKMHQCAVGPDHVHNVLSFEAPPEAVRRWLKTWLGQAMSARWPREGPWWAEGGSIKWVWNEAYFRRVFDYVRDQRATIIRR